MTSWFARPCHLVGLGILRCASLLVPADQRGMWWKEWHAELWHVRQACIPRCGISWSAEKQVLAFCLGAFQDSICLKEHCKERRAPTGPMRGSATQCILSLIALSAASIGAALLLPGASALLHPQRYHDGQNLVLIQDGLSLDDARPTISAAQYQTWKQRQQTLFDGFAFYQLTHGSVSEAVYPRTNETIAVASSNLFELLGQVTHRSANSNPGTSAMPKLILSNRFWREKYGGDPHVAGRIVRVGSTVAMIDGVAPEGFWRLPGDVGLWLLMPAGNGFSQGYGYVVGHLNQAATPPQRNQHWHMSAPTPDGSSDDFLCVSLAERFQNPKGLCLFAIFLACLALPATTSLSLGEYRVTSRKLSWATRVRRWSFLAGKILLLLPIVYFVSLDLAHLRAATNPLSSEYIQLISAFSICLFGLRWVLRDQRRRCPVCLRKLTHPARVGQPSRNFLAWNGMELVCLGGHGLLHVPEISMSWFSTQRWLYLDPSWEFLFAESALASTHYF